MPSIILYHHLRLGDHFMCHGIVREYCKKYEKVVIFCWPYNYPTVSFMYRDLPNLIIIKGGDDDANKFIKQNASQPKEMKYDEVKIVGFKYLNSSSGVPLEAQFYQHADVPLKKKWDSFFIQRDSKKEQGLFERFAPQGDYAFIHDDVSRGLTIKRELIGGNCTFIAPEKSFTDNIIDYCTIIEKAKEIHVIDSSFMFLIDCLPYNNPNQKLFIHRYARENDEWLLPILKKDWSIFVQRYDEIKPTHDSPMKDILEKISGVHNTVFKRFIRKIFRFMKWREVRPRHPDLDALIRRYVYAKSFLDVSPRCNKSRQKIALFAGAAMATSSTIEEASSADIVLYSDDLLTEEFAPELIKKIRMITNVSFIFHTKKLEPERLEALLVQAGFEAREKHLFPYEVCFVCRAVPQNHIL